jgi:hypothetical protein
MPQLKELISLSGNEPDFKETQRRDFSNINQKSFIHKHDRIKAAQQFKPVWEKAKEFLEIIASSKSKKQVNQAKEFASNILFGVENSKKNTLENTVKPTTPKPPKLGM